MIDSLLMRIWPQIPVVKPSKWAVFRDLRQLQEEGVVDAYVAVLLLANFFTMTLTHRGQPVCTTSACITALL